MEDRFDPSLVAALRAAGHEVQLVGAFDEMMGHAGALVLHRSGALAGLMQGASDPRSDGSAACA